ncbi:MAG TPA: hemolysin family protein, partial [Acidimicrobiia bacterium]|nr:hemolysin family protein [Acidimicrobiia bacterium]
EIFVVFTLFEVVPKTFALQHSDRSALLLSPVLVFVTRFWPLRVLTRGFIGIANVLLPGKGLRHGPFVTEEEILTMADVAAQEAAIETEERELIHSIFEFGDTVVREVMLPRTDMVAVEADATVDEAIEMAISAGKSRLPAYEDSIDDIVGLVFLKDLVARSGSGGGSEPVRQSLRPAHFVPESKRVAELLREMQTEKFHMAIVVDEYGGTAGLVTMEDLLEEIVGEITDEYDVDEPTVERLPTGSWRVPGRTPIDEISELLHTDLPQEEWDTVGGLVFNTLGHVPVEGECVVADGLEFCAERVQGRRIVSVIVTPRAVPQMEEQPAAADRAE